MDFVGPIAENSNILMYTAKGQKMTRLRTLGYKCRCREWKKDHINIRGLQHTI
jgi:hypothetical protein